MTKKSAFEEFAESEGLSIGDAAGLPFLDALPERSPRAIDVADGERDGRAVVVAECRSDIVRAPFLVWLVIGSEDSNPDALMTYYSCAAVKAHSRLPDCALLGRMGEYGGRFTPKRYRLPQTTPLRAGEEPWIVAQADGARPIALRHALPTAIEPFLRSLDPGTHVRLAPPWAICVVPGYSTYPSAFATALELATLF